MELTKTQEKPVVAEQPIETETIEVLVGSFGQNTTKVKVTRGTTLGDVAAAAGIGNMELHVNKNRKDKNYIMQEGDVVVGTPEAVIGGN